MRVANIRQWQWIVLSLLIGAGIGWARQWTVADLTGRFGEPLNGQARFEAALTSTVAGRPCFDDVRVYAASVPDRKGGAKRAFVVAGNYFNGQFQQSAGKLTAVWQPAFFVADIPYEPKVSLDALGRPDLAAQFRAIQRPTVVDFLDLVSHAKGTSYTRARWVELGMLGWIACSFIAIGVIWPVMINLIVYGSLRRPPEPKGVDLSKVKAPVPAAAAAAAPPDEVDLSALEAIEASLASGPAAAPAVATAPAGPAPVKALGGPGADEPIPVPSSHDQTEFGAAQEDYYPTAKRGPRTARKAPEDPRGTAR